MGSRVCCCYLLCMCVWTIFGVTLSVRCFRLLSSMCRTSEIDGRCVHLRGFDRCEISYAATLTRSMCRSMFEDPIDVNFIIMLLYNCTRITPRVCTLVLFIIIVIFVENASFTCKLRRHLLALMALTTSKPQNTDTNGIHATWA